LLSFADEITEKNEEEEKEPIWENSFSDGLRRRRRLQFSCPVFVTGQQLAEQAIGGGQKLNPYTCTPYLKICQNQHKSGGSIEIPIWDSHSENV
jgi:hypothetical protein